ncbi:flavin-containing monooxygenase [Bacillus salitolerans]|uniref:Flavin-containing monooxygenase n=1 Tax=Bacillus salitolerans TaxID=1437434 RepID=A0ABW4LQ27_9BACI
MIYDALVIGAGQAGPATGYHLKMKGLSFLILEGNTQPVGSWPFYYNSLKLFSPAGYSSLPGMKFPAPPNTYPTKEDVISYLKEYAAYFELPVKVGTRVNRVIKDGDIFTVFTETGSYQAFSLISATGSFSSPNRPYISGQEIFCKPINHSSEYHDATPFEGERIVIVGGRNSAVQIGVEISRIADVTLTSRKPINLIPHSILGQDIHVWARLSGLDKLPLGHWIRLSEPRTAIDISGYKEAFQAGMPDWRPMFSHLTRDGVQWNDGMKEEVDRIILATGYRSNFSYLSRIGALEPSGKTIQRAGISLNVPGLYYVGISGQRSISSATLRGVGSDAKYVINNAVRHLKKIKQG